MHFFCTTFHELLVSLSLSGCSKSLSIPVRRAASDRFARHQRSDDTDIDKHEEQRRGGGWEERAYDPGRCCGRSWGRRTGRRSPTPTSTSRRRPELIPSTSTPLLPLPLPQTPFTPPPPPGFLSPDLAGMHLCGGGRRSVGGLSAGGTGGPRFPRGSKRGHDRTTPWEHAACAAAAMVAVAQRERERELLLRRMHVPPLAAAVALAAIIRDITSHSSVLVFFFFSQLSYY